MYRVLIVEDDPMVAMINEQYIGKNRNFEIAGICHDGSSALAFLKEHTVDLVVMDVFMPHMNGFEMLRQIRSMQFDVDVIMVTAANDRENLEEALHLGVVDYLVKPFTFERFQMALDKYIAQNHALHDVSTLSQSNIDRIIEKTRNNIASLYPKGIQEKTLLMIGEQLSKQYPRWLTGDEVAEICGLTAVTVRRYMNYLTEIGKATGDMDYETGGRPCMRYRAKCKEN